MCVDADDFGARRGFTQQVNHIMDLDYARKAANSAANSATNAAGGMMASAGVGSDDMVLKQLRKYSRERKMLLDPRSSTFLSKWDALTATALVYVSVATPFEVGFIKSSGEADALFCINRLLDLIFTADMIVQFFVTFPLAGGEKGGRWAGTLGETASHYLRGWLALDFISLLPSIFDIMPVIEHYSALATTSKGGVALQAPSTGSKTDSLSGLRVIRVLRLLKMIKLLRVSRLLTRWQTEYPMPFAMLTVMQLTLLIVFATHWFGCLIGLLGGLEGSGTLETTWYATHGYCYPDYRLPQPNGATAKLECLGPDVLYFASFEWALGLVTGLDPLPLNGPRDPYCAAYYLADPHLTDCAGHLNQNERAMRLIMLLAGALIWSYVIARFVEVIVSTNPDAKAYRNAVDELNRFIEIQGLDHEIARRMYAATRAHAHHFSAIPMPTPRLCHAARLNVRPPSAHTGVSTCSSRSTL